MSTANCQNQQSTILNGVNGRFVVHGYSFVYLEPIHVCALVEQGIIDTVYCEPAEPWETMEHELIIKCENPNTDSLKDFIALVQDRTKIREAAIMLSKIGWDVTIEGGARILARYRDGVLIQEKKITDFYDMSPEEAETYTF